MVFITQLHMRTSNGKGGAAPGVFVYSFETVLHFVQTKYTMS